MKKTHCTTAALRTNNYFMIIVLSLFIVLSGALLLSNVSSAADADVDAEASRQSATFINNTLILELPELAVEGSELLYKVQMKLKQAEDAYILELIDLELSQYQEASIAAATLSTEGILHVPFLNIEGNLWELDLNLQSSTSLLPIRFGINMDTVAAVPFEHFDDNILGYSSRKCTYFCTPWGWCFSICEEIDKPPRPFDY